MVIAVARSVEDQKPSPKEFFSKYAEHYAVSKGHATGQDLALLMRLLDPNPADSALDVATGTGFTAVELARRVKSVVAADITEEMLAQAKKLAGERGLGNVRFEKADASRLPFPDSAFDIVTSRRAPHHFADVPQFLGEAVRILRVGGRLGIADMSPPDGSEDFFNSIELVRDSTHGRALTLSQWKECISRAGLSILAAETLSKEVSFQEWMYPVPMGGREESGVREAWKRAPAEICEALGLRMKDGKIEGWTKRWTVLVAQKH